MPVRGLRGATSVPSDTRENIIDATSELLTEMIVANNIPSDDLISIIFTATPDLRSEFPAAAARQIGIVDVPLLCAAEIDVRGALPRIIRILMHVSSNKGRADLHHVYLREAEPLRNDLPR